MGKPELALFAKQDGTGRAYKHPFRVDGDGKPLTSPSVTTVLGLVDKPALIQWAADRTLDWAVDNASLLFVKEKEAAKKWGRYRWADVRNERAEVGTGIHETIEAQHTGSWNFPVLDDEQVRIMQQWDRLNEQYEFVPHRSEFTVWSLAERNGVLLDYAGTADGLWDITDLSTGESWENLIIDLKTSKNTWPEHWTQLSALYNADYIMDKTDDKWTEVELPANKSGTAIIHLREDKASVTVETDKTLLHLQYEQFLAYRHVWGTKKETDNYASNREKNERMKF